MRRGHSALADQQFERFIKTGELPADFGSADIRSIGVHGLDSRPSEIAREKELAVCNKQPLRRTTRQPKKRTCWESDSSSVVISDDCSTQSEGE